MALVWESYETDCGKIYPFLALSAVRVNEVASTIDVVGLLPASDRAEIVAISRPCSVPQLTKRKIRLHLNDDSIWEISYLKSFNGALYDHLRGQLTVLGFEFIGERVSYSRLRKMLDYLNG